MATPRTLGQLFLHSVLSRVRASASMSPSRRLNVLQTSVSELSRLSSIEPSLGDPSSFARTYLEGQTLFLRIVQATGWSGPSLQVVRDNIHTLQAISRKLHSMFS